MLVTLHINLCIEIQIVRVEWSMEKYLASVVVIIGIFTPNEPLKLSLGKFDCWAFILVSPLQERSL